jgi:hypothetical protein
MAAAEITPVAITMHPTSSDADQHVDSGIAAIHP